MCFTHNLCAHIATSPNNERKSADTYSMKHSDSLPFSSAHSAHATSPLLWFGPPHPWMESVQGACAIIHIHSLEAAWYVFNTMWPCALVVDLTGDPRHIVELLATARQHWPDIPIIGLYDKSVDKQLSSEVSCLVSMQETPRKLIRLIREQQTRLHLAPRPIEPASLQKRIQHLEKLLHAITLLAGSDENATVFQGLQVVGEQVLGAETIAVLLTDEEYTELDNRLHLAIPQVYVDVCNQIMRSVERREDRALYLGEEVLFSTVPLQTEHVFSPFLPEAHALNASSYMRLPLNVGDRTVGFVALATRQPGHFRGEHLQLGRLFAAQVAAAIRVIELRGRQSELEGRQRTLSDIAKIISESDTPLEDTLTRILEEAIRLVDGRNGIVLLLDSDGTLTVRAVYGTYDVKVGDRVPQDVGQVGLVLSTKKPSAIPHYRDWPHANPAVRDKVNSEASVIGVPLIYQGQVLGVLQVVCDYSTQPALNEARDVLSLLAPQAALAIAKGRLHEELHEVIRQERRQLRAILEHIPVAVMVCDAEGIIQRANRASEELLQALGLNFETVRGRHILEVAAHLLPDGLPPDIQVAHPFEVYLGDLGEYLVTVAPIARKDGKIEAYVGVAQDVTALRRLDRMRANLNRILTHDLGNLLMLARTPLELLDEPDLPPEQRQQLKAMLTGSLQRMSDLITDVMHMEMADSLGQQKFTPYTLETIVRRAIKRYENAAKQAGITLTYHEKQTPPHQLLGHEVLVTQSVENLLSNAIKYTPHGGHVTVTLDVAGEEAIVQVRDDGYGIPQDKLQAIFEPFVRIKSPPTRNIPGTGLGLSLVKQFVESHSGYVEVQSRLEQGSTFTIHLPLQPQGAPRPPEDRLPRLDLAKKVEELSGKKRP